VPRRGAARDHHSDEARHGEHRSTNARRVVVSDCAARSEGLCVLTREDFFQTMWISEAGPNDNDGTLGGPPHVTLRPGTFASPATTH
jgi:hypothetical protein